MMRTSGQRHGVTLIEMLVVILLLAVLGGVLSMMLKETLLMESVQAAGFDKLLHDNALADRFRADVALATIAPTRWNEYTVGRNCLILEAPGKGHVVYIWNEETLQRHVFADGTARAQIMPVDGTDVAVEFGVDPGLKLVHLRLLTPHKGQALPGQTLEFVAALGGDWR